MRGTTPYDRRGVPLVLPNGSLDIPSLRFSGVRSGLTHLGGGALGVSINQFLSLGVADDGLLIRSNSGSTASPSALVTPLSLDRSNATVNNGDETALDIQEVGVPVGRVALYRESPTRRGWRFYGYNSGLNTVPILDLHGDGRVTAQGSITLSGPVTLSSSLNGTTAVFSSTLQATSSTFTTVTTSGGAAFNSDTTITRAQAGLPGNGYLYLGNTGHHLGWNGSAFTLNGPLGVGGLLSANDGLTVTGAVTLPAGAVSPSAIGNLTIAEAAPTVDTATLGTLLNNLAHRTMSIIGVADWKGAIPANSTLTNLDTRVTEVAVTAGHAHPYAASSHTTSGDHDVRYAASSHTTSGDHDARYIHTHPYAPSSHPASGDHDARYAASSHTASGDHDARYIHTHPYAPNTHTTSGDHDARYIHTHPYSADTHNHSGVYAPTHTHPYSADTHNHSGVYAPTHSHPYSADTHNHSGVYAPTHTHPYAPDTHPASGDHDGRYVNVTGDSMSGTLTLSGSGYALDLTYGSGSIRTPFIFVTSTSNGALHCVGTAHFDSGITVAGNLSVSCGGTPMGIFADVLTYTTATSNTLGGYVAIIVNGATFKLALYNL